MRDYCNTLLTSGRGQPPYKGQKCQSILYLEAPLWQDQLCKVFLLTNVELLSLAEILRCFLCEGGADIKLMPCGHVNMCHICIEASRVKKCPDCRVSITPYYKVAVNPVVINKHDVIIILQLPRLVTYDCYYIY